MNLTKIFRTGLILSLPWIFTQAQVVRWRPQPRPERTATGRASEAFPEPPAHKTDTDIVIDGAPDLDWYTGNKIQPVFRIEIPIKRYVGPVDSDGRLKNVGALIDQGVVSRYATLSFPIYDVDFDGDPNDPARPPERNYISFNGKEYGYAMPATGLVGGGNNQWGLYTLKIPISELKFPERGADGQEPAEAINELVIRIDELNGDWYTSVDWVELKFEAMAPIFLVHGVDAQHNIWEVPANDSFVDHFNGIPTPITKYLGPWSYDINLSSAQNGNESIQINGDTLKTRLTALMAGFGAKRCHLIGHSKGGLDSGECIKLLEDLRFINPDSYFKVLSLYTIGSPHRGSVLADIGQQNVEARSARGISGPDPILNSLARFDAWARLVGGAFNWELANPTRGPALFDLQTCRSYERLDTDRTVQFLTDDKGKTHFYNVVGDADANGDYKISSTEARELIPLPRILAPSLGTDMYVVVGNVQTVEVTRSADRVSRTLTPIYTATFTPNDMVVAVTSGIFPGALKLDAPLPTIPSYAPPKPGFLGTYTPKNHTVLKNAATAKRILEQIILDFPVNAGDQP